MLFRTAIKYYFLDLAIDSIFIRQKDSTLCGMSFTGIPCVGDRFSQFVFVNDNSNREYRYLNVLVTEVTLCDGHFPYIEFTFHGIQSVKSGEPTTMEDRSGQGRFILDGSVRMYQ